MKISLSEITEKLSMYQSDVIDIAQKLNIENYPSVSDILAISTIYASLNPDIEYFNNKLAKVDIILYVLLFSELANKNISESVRYRYFCLLKNYITDFLEIDSETLEKVYIDRFMYYSYYFDFQKASSKGIILSLIKILQDDYYCYDFKIYNKFYLIESKNFNFYKNFNVRSIFYKEFKKVFVKINRVMDIAKNIKVKE